MPDSSPLSRYDLNMLVALDALLTERHVTRAAERMHLSQPAMSASLSRLRDHFDDPLLYRRGNAYELTPLALRLIDQLPSAVDGVRRILETQSNWDPGKSSREFHIYSSDYGIATTGAVVSRLASQEAESVTFRFSVHDESIVDHPDTALRTADAMIIPRGYLRGLPSMDLWQDRWVAACSRDHPAAEEGLEFESLATYPWVLTYRSSTAHTAVDRQLEQMGIQPKVEAIAQGFASIPHFLIGTRRLGLMQAGMVARAGFRDEITVLKLPFEPTPLTNTVWWHPTHEHDPAHRWLRSLFQRAGEELSGLPDEVISPSVVG